MKKTFPFPFISFQLRVLSDPEKRRVRQQSTSAARDTRPVCTALPFFLLTAATPCIPHRCELSAREKGAKLSSVQLAGSGWRGREVLGPPPPPRGDSRRWVFR